MGDKSIKPVAWTPGPWTEAWSGRTDGDRMTGVHCEIQGPEIDSQVFVPMRPTICDVRDHMSRRIWQANARLIALAPELAEALQKLVDTFGVRHETHCRFDCDESPDCGTVCSCEAHSFQAEIVSLLARITSK